MVLLQAPLQVHARARGRATTSTLHKAVAPAVSKVSFVGKFGTTHRSINDDVVTASPLSWRTLSRESAIIETYRSPM
jgi:hypothetical protein